MGTATAAIQGLADAVKSAFGVTVTVRWSTGGTFVAATGKWSGTPASATVSADEQMLETFTTPDNIRMEERPYHITKADLEATAIPGGVIRQGMTIIGTDGVERGVSRAELQCDGALYRVITRREKGTVR